MDTASPVLGLRPVRASVPGRDRPGRTPRLRRRPRRARPPRHGRPRAVRTRPASPPRLRPARHRCARRPPTIAASGEARGPVRTTRCRRDGLVDERREARTLPGHDERQFGLQRFPAPMDGVARQQIAAGDSADPAAQRDADRKAATVKALGERFLDKYVPTHCEPSTAYEYRRSVKLFIHPTIGPRKVTKIQRSDIAELHHGLPKTAQCATLGLRSCISLPRQCILPQALTSRRSLWRYMSSWRLTSRDGSVWTGRRNADCHTRCYTDETLVRHTRASRPQI